MVDDAKAATSAATATGPGHQEPAQAAGPQTNTAPKTEVTTLDDLAFECDRLARYHEKRRRFFERLHKFFMALIIIGSSATAAALLGEASVSWTAFAITVLAAFDMVVGPAGRAREHEGLFRRYIDLSSEVDAEQIKESEGRGALVAQLSTKFHRIVVDEPPAYHVLAAIAYNEAAAGQGAPQRFVITRWQRVLANIWPWSSDSLSLSGTDEA